MSTYQDKLTAATLDVDRLARALNKTGGYVTTDGVSVETWRDMLARQQGEFEDALPELVDEATATAVAASAASGVVAWFDSKAALEAALATLSDNVYGVVADETHDDRRYRYRVTDHAIVNSWLDDEGLKLTGDDLTATPGLDAVPEIENEVVKAQAQALLNRLQYAADRADAFFEQKVIPAGVLRTWGHSIMYGASGGGVTIGTNDLATLLSQRVGLINDQHAVSGAVLYNHLSAADWAAIMQAETRPQKFAALGGAYALMYGINDIANLGNDTADLEPFGQALRLAIARLRSAAVFEDSDSSVAFGGSGTWAKNVSTVSNSGGGYRYNVTAGATFTITTPANFPGGTMNIGMFTWNDGGGGTVTGPAELGSPSINTTAFSGTDSRHGCVLRITDVPKGAASYVFTTSSVTGSAGVIFDWWGWEPHETACPAIAVIGMPKPLDYTSQEGSPAGPATDTGVDNMNAIQQAIVAEFGDRVAYVDCSAIDKDSDYWVAGNIHPKANGHDYIAQQTADALNAMGRFVEAELNYSKSDSAAQWSTYTPEVSGAGSSLGNGTIAGNCIKQADGTVHFYARFTLGSTSTIGTQLRISLPFAESAGNSIAAMSCLVERPGTGFWLLAGNIDTSGQMTVRVIGTNGALSNVSATSPLTWASGDRIDVRGTYRASS